MSHHITYQILLNYPQSFPNLFRSVHSSHKNLFEWPLRKMNKESHLKSEVIDWRLWLTRVPPGHSLATWINVSALERPICSPLLWDGWEAQLSVLFV